MKRETSNMSPVARSVVNEESKIRSDQGSVIYGKGERSEVFQKMKSTGQIETTRKIKSTQCGIKMSHTSHTISTDLISMKNLSKSKIIDSHTSYRQVLDEKITSLKVQLVEQAQSKADILQNELVLTTKDCEIQLTKIDDLKK